MRVGREEICDGGIAFLEGVERTRAKGECDLTGALAIERGRHISIMIVAASAPKVDEDGKASLRRRAASAGSEVSQRGLH
jgi:hypothetical protein